MVFIQLKTQRLIIHPRQMNPTNEPGSVEHVYVDLLQGSGDEAKTLAALPNEILLQIFRLLEYEDLLTAEQVCLKWKNMVKTCLATEKQLSLSVDLTEQCSSLNRMKRYGSSIHTLKVYLDEECDSAEVNWAEEIAERFPRLITMELHCIRISDGGFKCLSTKCSQLTNVTLHYCTVTDEGLRIFFQALPGIKVLSISIDKYPLDVEIEDHLLPQASAVFSTCRSLHTFRMTGHFQWNVDPASFSRFCKECVTLRKLDFMYSNMPAEMFAQIQHCSLLEELQFDSCRNIDDSTLDLITSKGCPNLRSVTFIFLDTYISDEGLKCFGRCANLNLFMTDLSEMTDDTLVELSKCVNLRKVRLMCPLVGDRGCVALIAQCPQLEQLTVPGCEGVSNATVDAAMAAIECRHNGLVLELAVSGRRITRQPCKNCHQLLRLILI